MRFTQITPRHHAANTKEADPMNPTDLVLYVLTAMAAAVAAQPLVAFFI